MNHEEATALVRERLSVFRATGYAGLRSLVDTRLPTLTVTGASGADYQIATRVYWDAEQGGVIRVIGEIDDGGWRAFVPVVEDFIVRPDNEVLATW